MRLFIGIGLNDATKEVSTIIEKLKQFDRFANYTTINNLHLTLAFLGEVNNGELSVLKGIINNLEINHFELTINKLVNFKDMYVLELNKSKELQILQESLENNLVNSGFEFETRPFYPHITLSRNVSKKLNEELSITFSVREVVLFSSIKIDNQLRYVPMYSKILR